MEHVELIHPPIVEAVVDIECDFPPGQELARLEGAARGQLGERYPGVKRRFAEEVQFVERAGEPLETSSQRRVEALQFFQEDERQLVQLRRSGYSFNRLAPYTTLDDYLPEIERTWRVFSAVTSPVQIQRVRLRYINRLLLPIVEGRFDLDAYLQVGPRLPDAGLNLQSFLNQYHAQDQDTGNVASVLLHGGQAEGSYIPIILDITVTAPGPGEVEDWLWVRSRIESARTLKNRIFWTSLTATCLQLFQPA